MPAAEMHSRSPARRRTRRSRESRVHRPSDQDSCAGCRSQLPQPVTARCHSMSQLCPGSRDAFSQTIVPRRICGCDTGFDQQSFLQERLQVSLERAMVRSGAESLVVLDCDAPLLDDVVVSCVLSVDDGLRPGSHVGATVRNCNGSNAPKKAIDHRDTRKVAQLTLSC